MFQGAVVAALFGGCGHQIEAGDAAAGGEKGRDGLARNVLDGGEKGDNDGLFCNFHLYLPEQLPSLSTTSS